MQQSLLFFPNFLLIHLCEHVYVCVCACQDALVVRGQVAELVLSFRHGGSRA